MISKPSSETEFSPTLKVGGIFLSLSRSVRTLIDGVQKRLLLPTTGKIVYYRQLPGKSSNRHTSLNLKKKRDLISCIR
jgi:hypothetical protein